MAINEKGEIVFDGISMKDIERARRDPADFRTPEQQRLSILVAKAVGELGGLPSYKIGFHFRVNERRGEYPNTEQQRIIDLHQQLLEKYAHLRWRIDAEELAEQEVLSELSILRKEREELTILAQSNMPAEIRDR